MNDLQLMIDNARDITEKAITDHNPSHVLCLFSGGYDSMVATHVIHAFDLSLPVLVYSIDTQLSADGWRDYVTRVARQFGWRHDIYDNGGGYEEYAGWVEKNGQPYSRKGHMFAYNRLKGRAIDAMKRDHKTGRFDRILMISGVRKNESSARQKLESPYSRYGSAVFVNPLFHWLENHMLAYRLEHELPENPFYETVGGSGDCQCNWGQFIDLETLKKHSPCLAQSRVAYLDKLSRENHGWGWGEKPSEYDLRKQEGQMELFPEEQDFDGVPTSPFLCEGCSRSKSPRLGRSEAEQSAMLQRMLW